MSRLATVRFCIPALAGAALLASTTAEPEPRALAIAGSFEGDFTIIASVRELRDGRILVTDPKEPAIYLVDWTKKTTRRIGTKGAGPGEYLMPGGLYAGQADSTFVVDRGQLRHLALDATGMVGTTHTPEPKSVPRGQGIEADAYAIDLYGNLYSARPHRAPASGIDSSLVVRFDAARRATDTLARLRVAATERATAGGMTFSQSTFFSPADGWAVAPTGRVAIVRAVPYHVEWIEPNRAIVVGVTIPTDVVPVTSAERDSIRGEIGPPPTFTIADTKGVAHTITAPAFEPKFANVKPVFEPNAIVVSPDGRVWVRRVRPRNTKTAVYDVFDGRGARVDRVSLPSGSVVVGFGSRVVYVAELDENDLPHLKKYAT